jgi:peptidylprolyl isomerase
MLMRRRHVALLGCLALVLPLAAGCGGDGGAGVKVTGGFGTQPNVLIPKGSPPKGFTERTLVHGRGPKVGDGDLVIAEYAGYTWNSSANRLIGSSYVGSSPSAFPSWRLVPGLRKALVGARTGSRVLAVIPPSQGYGPQGDPQLSISGSDSLVYVLDVMATFGRSAGAGGKAEPLDDPSLPQVGSAGPGQAPPVAIPHTGPPSQLQVRTLIQGTGAQVKSGQTLAVQYSGYLWRTGQIFDSSYTAGHVFSTVIGAKQVVQGWDQGLVGQTVGSRVLLVVPPAYGYGGQGLKQAGIRGDDTLVYVIDVLGAY